tara:strand:- start:53 stop:466 length:414 start_codon:yes stop_codon:yes gene_type:complete
MFKDGKDYDQSLIGLCQPCQKGKVISENQKKIASAISINLWKDPDYRNGNLKSRKTSKQAMASLKRESRIEPYYIDYLRGNKSYHDIARLTNLGVDSVGFFIRRFNTQNGYKVVSKNRDNQSMDRYVYDSNGKLLDV